MKILSLNCQMGFNSDFDSFLERTLRSQAYDFLLLQEFTSDMLSRHATQGGYKSLRAHNDEIGKESHLCVLYRPEFALLDTMFISFNSFCPRLYREQLNGRAEFGFLAGIFRVDGRDMVLGSIHLHAGPFVRVRRRELSLVRDRLMTFGPGIPVFFAGDCNYGLPGELRSADTIVGSAFARVSKGLPPTLDSRYTEFEPNPLSMTAVLLSKFGLGIRLRADQVFATASLAQNGRMSCRVLSDRVSDHSPIELMLS